MAKEIGVTLYLNKEESIAFIRNLMHPDEEVVRRRNEFFKEIDRLGIQRLSDGTVIIDSPDITLE